MTILYIYYIYIYDIIFRVYRIYSIYIYILRKCREVSRSDEFFGSNYKVAKIPWRFIKKKNCKGLLRLGVFDSRNPPFKYFRVCVIHSACYNCIRNISILHLGEPDRDNTFFARQWRKRASRGLITECEWSFLDIRSPREDSYFPLFLTRQARSARSNPIRISTSAPSGSPWKCQCAVSLG